jgi:hypothetical protein
VNNSNSQVQLDSAFTAGLAPSQRNTFQPSSSSAGASKAGLSSAQASLAGLGTGVSLAVSRPTAFDVIMHTPPLRAHSQHPLGVKQNTPLPIDDVTQVDAGTMTSAKLTVSGDSSINCTAPKTAATVSSSLIGASSQAPDTRPSVLLHMPAQKRRLDMGEVGTGYQNKKLKMQAAKQ